MTVGRLTVAWSAGQIAFDPHQGPEHLATPWMTPLHRTLLRRRLDGTLGAGLAGSWRFADDGRRLTLRLRDGATFHDGTPLGAAAVVAALERARTEAAAPVVREHLAPVEAIASDGDHVVHLEVTDRASGLPAALATAVGMVPHPTADLAIGASTSPIGSGAWMLAPGTSSADVQRSSVGYVRTTGSAATSNGIDEMSLRIEPDHRRRLDDLLAGVVDVIDVRGDIVRDARAMAATGRFTLATYATSTTLMVQLDRRSDVLADVRAREALELAVDRTALLAPFGGLAEPTVQSLPPSSPAFDPDLERRTRVDPRRARSLLAAIDAGGLRLRMLQFEDVTPVTAAGQTLAGRLRDVGFEVDVVSMRPADLVAAWQAGGFDLRLALATSIPDDASILHRRLNGAQSPGDLSVISPSLAATAAQLFAQHDGPIERQALHRDLNRSLVEQHVLVEVGRLRNEVLAQRYVTGVDRMPLGQLNLFDATVLGVDRPGASPGGSAGEHLTRSGRHLARPAHPRSST